MSRALVVFRRAKSFYKDAESLFISIEECLANDNRIKFVLIAIASRVCDTFYGTSNHEKFRSIAALWVSSQAGGSLFTKRMDG